MPAPDAPVSSTSPRRSSETSRSLPWTVTPLTLRAAWRTLSPTVLGAGSSGASTWSGGRRVTRPRSRRTLRPPGAGLWDISSTPTPLFTTPSTTRATRSRMAGSSMEVASSSTR